MQIKAKFLPSIVGAILSVLSFQEKRNATKILSLFVLSSIFEVVSIVSILPFISLLSDSSLVESNEYLKWLYELSGVTAFSSFAILIGLTVLLANIISICVRALTLYANLQFCYRAEYSISFRLTQLFLAQSYEWSLNKNSNSLSKAVLSEVHQYIHGGLGPLIVLIAQSSVVVGILIILSVTNFLATVSAALILGSFYFLVSRYTRNVLKKIGDTRVQSNDQRFRFLSEIFTSMKEIKLSQTDEVFVNKFKVASDHYSRANVYAGVLGVLPRFAIEGLVIVSVLLSLLVLIERGVTLIDILPTLTLFVFAMVRILPAAQQCYAATTAIRYNTPTIRKLVDDIETGQKNLASQENNFPDKSSARLTSPFQSLELNQITFSYCDAEHPAINKVDFTIRSGEKIGIIGETGSGKTTLVNIILGLLAPQHGDFSVNGEKVENGTRWLLPQNLFGYVPQDIVLLDDDLKANIAFGLSEIDASETQILRAIEVAELSTFTNNLTGGLSTQLGERGAKLSGGQRQRIGIARAILRRPSILVLDEGTSALDTKTEDAVMRNMDDMQYWNALLVVAHRLSTVKNCDRIYVMKAGKVAGIGSYSELLKKNIIIDE